MTDLVQKLVGALEGLDEAYCRAGSPLTREERAEDRKRLIAARAALSEAKAGGWQDMESAPRDGSMFLCWVEAVRYGETDDGQQYQQDASEVDFCRWRACDESPNGGYFDNMAGQIADLQHVTKWQPPPAPPAQRGEG